jgi:hypothetical protein
MKREAKIHVQRLFFCCRLFINIASSQFVQGEDRWMIAASLTHDYLFTRQDGTVDSWSALQIARE